MGEDFGTIEMVRTVFPNWNNLFFSDELIHGASYGIIGYDGNGELQYSELETLIACFTSGTLIETECGAIAIEKLRVGDLIKNIDNRDKPIRWIGSSKVSYEEMRQNQKLYPIRILAGACGQGVPRTDLLVSRQHRMLVRSKIAKRITGQSETLVAAIKLTELPNIFVDQNVEEVEYYHMLFDDHQVVFANGAPCESLFTGPQALEALGCAARAEILTLFPNLLAPDIASLPARVVVSGKQQGLLAARHAKHSKPILEWGHC
ncbi:MAG: Hint domain-containing protein [Aliishimia sp.]